MMIKATHPGAHRGQPTRVNSRRAQWLGVGLALAFPALLAVGAEVPAAAQFRKDIQPILKEYCYDCHGDGEKKGKIAFDELKTDEALLNHDLWLKVVKNVRAGIMPPSKKPRPSPDDWSRLENWVKADVFGIDPKNPDPGRITVRRLNRVEYRNTVRDLLGVDYDTQGEFPPDDTGYGFDNIGDVLTVSPMLLEKYLIAAKQVVSEAVPVVSRVMPEKIIPGARFTGLGAGTRSGRTNAPSAGTRGNGANSLSLSFYEPAAVSNQFNVAIAGSYRLALDLAVRGNFEFDPGKCRVVVTLDGKELLAEEFGWYNDKSFAREFPERFEPGSHQVNVTLEPLVPSEKKRNNLDFRVVSMTLRGPLEEKLWTKPKNYDRFFTRDDAPKGAAERRKYARQLLSAFATKAFRRPADPSTVERLVALAEQVYNQPGKTFEAGIAHAMVGTLASPRFVFRMEDNLKPAGSSAWGLVDEYTLASRLSYFLWSSMPDQELFDLAAKGELRKNLPAQVTRMLADSRSESLAQNFTGQWLEARDVDALAIDARAVFAREAAPGTNASPALASKPNAAAEAGAGLTNRPLGAAFNFTNALAAAGGKTNRVNFGNVNGRRTPPRVQLDQALKRSMRSETEMYFSNLVHEDRSVIELIESDYTFVNEGLAKVYGLTNLNIRGPEMRKVTLPPGDPRGGILTEGTVLTVTSNPDRTSPVKRGLFILNNILGTPVPAPPPNIPALEATEKDFFKDHQPTLREALTVHRESPLCSSCHSRMDPIGLGMENFNALGVWRDKERGQTIDTAGKLVTGETFNSVQELKHILATKHKADFYRCLTEKLLTYALGRGTEYYDLETVDQIVRRLDQEDGRFGALLMGVIESAPFQQQRNRPNSAFADSRESSSPENATLVARNKPTP